MMQSTTFYKQEAEEFKNDKDANINYALGVVLAAAICKFYQVSESNIKKISLHDVHGFYVDVKLGNSIKKTHLKDLQHAMLKILKSPKPFRTWQREDNWYASLTKDSVTEYLCPVKPLNVSNALQHFALTNACGVNEDHQLFRVYGIGAQTHESLQSHLHPKTLDHKTIGSSLNLFHFDDQAPGMAYWHANGLILRDVIENIIRAQDKQEGYQEVTTPVLAKESLWDKSGHLCQYRENMFTTKTETGDYLIKPMNCPLHARIFNTQNVSYKSLPMKISEFGLVHRYESSGSLNGLFRARSFTQDDAHIFCDKVHVQDETVTLIKRILSFYRQFSFNTLKIVLAGKPEKCLGEDRLWQEAEDHLRLSLEQTQVPYTYTSDGAFYGPKIEFSLQDNMGRWWQCGTVQLDFFMSRNLDCSYKGSDGQQHYPIVIHRAIVGSLERFIAIILEQYQGKLPIWLCPQQIVICSLNEECNTYATHIADTMQQQNIRCITDLQLNLSLGARIKGHHMSAIPMIGIVGIKEKREETISVRQGYQTLKMNLAELINTLNSTTTL